MLLDQVNALDDVSSAIKKINSLLTIVNDYFDNRDPKDWELQVRYSIYADLADIAHSMALEQQIEVETISSSLYAISKQEAEKAELLEGGVSND